VGRTRTILLSINPEHVSKIFDNTKKYEFRRIRCKFDISTILIYCTCPVKKVVGEAHVKTVIVDSPESLWSKTNGAAGINKKFYDSYFSGRDTAVAYELSNVKKYDRAKELSEYGVKVAPQSFVYVEDY